MAASFQGLGPLVADAVSPDGSVVVGSVTTPGGVAEAAEWTQSSPIVLKGASGNPVQGNATGVSNDGTVIVGVLDGTQGIPTTPAFSWTNGVETTITGLGSPSYSTASAVSPNGSIIVGGAGFGGYDLGYVLNGTNSPVEIPAKNTVSGLDSASASAVSSDGSVVAGTYFATGTSLNGSPFVWIDGQFHEIIESGASSGTATAVSSDGSVVVGEQTFFSGSQLAFSWTAQNGPTNLPFPDGVSTPMTATGVSDNGSFIVGYYGGTGASPSATTMAFIWNQATKTTESLKQYLGDLVPAGWKLTVATAITHDGNTIVGEGIDPGGRQESWIVTGLNPTTPTPTSPTPTSPTPTSPTPTSPTPTSPTPTSPTPTPTKPPTSPTSGFHRTKTLLTAKPRPANSGRTVTFTVTVQCLGHGGGKPTGDISFLDGSTVLDTVSLKGGKARFATSSLSVGSHKIRAVYVASGDFDNSQSATVNEKIKAGHAKSLLDSSAVFVGASENSSSRSGDGAGR